MRLAHDLEPGRDRALARRDAPADLVVEDLGPAAGHRIEPGGDQALEDRGDGQVLALGEVADLLGREAVDGQREAGLHEAEQILEVVEAELGIDPALEQDLDAAQVDRLLQLAGQLVARQRVRLGSRRAGGGSCRTGRPWCRRWCS